jgi:hypothetical protein
MKYARRILLSLVVLLTLAFVLDSSQSLKAQKPSISLKSYLSKFRDKRVVFDLKDMRPCQISEINEDFLVARLDKESAYIIPFHAIQRAKVGPTEDYPILLCLSPSPLEP